MCRPNLERSVAAVVISLLVAGLLLVGTAQAMAQPKSNGQGIPQQINALEQQIAAINLQLKTLSGQPGITPGGGSAKVLRVLDANGTEVGPMIMPTYVVRKAGDSWLVLGVTPNAFVQLTTEMDIPADHCGGKRYMQDYGELLKWAVVVDGIAHYASGPPQNVAVGAWYKISPGVSVCVPVTGEPAIMQGLSEVGTLDLSGFVAPFTVHYDQ